MKIFLNVIMLRPLLLKLSDKIYAADISPQTGDNTKIIFAAIVILVIALFIFIRRRTPRP